eukprot:GSA25T00005336001.1
MEAMDEAKAFGLPAIRGCVARPPKARGGKGKNQQDQGEQGTSGTKSARSADAIALDMEKARAQLVRRIGKLHWFWILDFALLYVAHTL